MQKYTTPAPGRTPATNWSKTTTITDRQGYKLEVTVQPSRGNEFLITITRTIQEVAGPSKLQLFLSKEELELLRLSLI